MNDAVHTVGCWRDEMQEVSHQFVDRLQYARVLVELGELREAELEVAEILDAEPDSLDPLSLYAKIKHIRGEISQAVACWAQIQARTPRSEMARMHLQSMLHLAQNPERGAGEFLAVGQFQLVRKPAAYLALEEAFRLYLSRRPQQARAHCARIAQKYRSRDRDVYKLAVLANAWIGELIGEYEDAADLLETLGRERGFETDLDRLMALMRIYEHLGTPGKLDAAINICRFLERNVGDVPVLGRLVRLYRRRGRLDLARKYQVRHEDAFRQAMHTPSFADVIAVASERYLPLPRLRTIPFASRELPPDMSAREVGVAMALRGNPGQAREKFAEGGECLDQKYLGDLAVLEGDYDEAALRYLRALGDHPDDLQGLAWLIDALAEHDLEPIVAHFQRPEVAEVAVSVLRAAVQVHPQDPRPWRRLATFLALQPGLHEEYRQSEDRAVVLEEAARKEAEPIGRVLAAAVYRFAGQAHGLMHEVWVDREPTDPGQGGMLPIGHILGNLTDEMKQTVRNSFLAVREYTRTKFPHLADDLFDYNYSYKVTKEDEPSGGTSAGLPTVLAFLSVFLQRPIPQDIAATGVLVTDAHNVLLVNRVGDVEYKVAGAYNRNLQRIIVPRANQPELEQSDVVPRGICAEIAHYAENLDEAVRIAFGEDVFI